MIYVVFSLYVIGSGVVLLAMTKGRLNEWLFKFVIVTFLPVIGWFLPSIWPKKWLKHDENFFEHYMKNQTIDLTSKITPIYVEIEREQELNIVSIEEALLVSDYATRRRVMIDILKQDAMQYIDVIKTAVMNEDTETSHYAVTAVVEVKRQLMILLQKLAVEYPKNPKDIQLVLTYAEVVKEYLRSGFLDAQSMKYYQMTYIQLLNHIIQANHATEEIFIEKIMMELTIHDLANAEATAQQFKKQYPLSEEAYLQAMSIYFKARAFNKLQAEMALLETTPITLSNRALTILRYWKGVNVPNESTT